MDNVKITYEYVPFNEAVPKPNKDIVPVVRCKNCKHRYNSIHCPIALIADLLKDTKVFEYKVDDDWFCGDGKRRSE